MARLNLMVLLTGDCHLERLIIELPALVNVEVIRDRTFGDFIGYMAKDIQTRINPLTTGGSSIDCTIDHTEVEKKLRQLTSYLETGYKDTLEQHFPVNSPEQIKMGKIWRRDSRRSWARWKSWGNSKRGRERNALWNYTVSLTKVIGTSPRKMLKVGWLDLRFKITFFFCRRNLPGGSYWRHSSQGAEAKRRWAPDSGHW